MSLWGYTESKHTKPCSCGDAMRLCVKDHPSDDGPPAVWRCQSLKAYTTHSQGCWKSEVVA